MTDSSKLCGKQHIWSDTSPVAAVHTLPDLAAVAGSAASACPPARQRSHLFQVVWNLHFRTVTTERKVIWATAANQHALCCNCTACSSTEFTNLLLRHPQLHLCIQKVCQVALWEQPAASESSLVLLLLVHGPSVRCSPQFSRESPHTLARVRVM